MRKRWWKSKTLWFNTALAIGTVAEANFGMLRERLGPESYLAAVALIAGVNFALRFITTKPLGKDKPQ
jgi:hypothetical protein